MSRAALADREPLLLGAPAPVLAAGGAVLAVLVAVAETLLTWRGITSWPLEAGALAALVAAGTVVVVRASPFRAPFRPGSHVLVLGLVLLAVLLDEAAQRGGDGVVLGDWGPSVVPLFLLVLAVLRPPREVLAGGLVAAAAVVAVVAAAAPSLERAAVAVTEVVPPALAAAALARTTLRRIERHVRPAAPDVPADAALSVQQETIARLEADAIPLLSAVAAAGAVTAEQAERARSIAAGLRTALVTDLARGWLADLGFVVDDPGASTERLTPEQRTALRTTIASLPLADFEHPGTAAVTGQDRGAALELVLPVAAPPRRSRVAPLVPLLRAAFPRADVHLEEHRVIVRVDVAPPR